MYIDIVITRNKLMFAFKMFKGRQEEDFWVTSYKLQYSNVIEFTTWSKILDNNVELVFDGNRNRNSKVLNFLPKPIIARYVRLLPVSSHTSVMLRWEVFGCKQFGTIFHSFWSSSIKYVRTEWGGGEGLEPMRTLMYK